MQDASKQYQNDASKLTDNESEGPKGANRNTARENLTDLGTAKAGGGYGGGNAGSTAPGGGDTNGGNAGGAFSGGGDALAQIRALSGAGDYGDLAAAGGADGGGFGNSRGAGGGSGAGGGKMQEQLVDLRAAMGKNGTEGARGPASAGGYGAGGGADGAGAGSLAGNGSPGGARGGIAPGGAEANGALGPVQGSLEGGGATGAGGGIAGARGAAAAATAGGSSTDRLHAQGKAAGESEDTDSQLTLRELVARLVAKAHARELCFLLLLVLLAIWIRSQVGENRGRWYAALALLLTLAYAASAPQREVASEIHWYTDEQEAMAKARELGLPVFVDIRADWCEPCRAIERTLLSDPEVHEKLSRFIALRIDVTRQTEEDKAKLVRFGVEGLPALVFVDTHGNVLQNLAAGGAPGKRELLGVLDSL